MTLFISESGPITCESTLIYFLFFLSVVFLSLKNTLIQLEILDSLMILFPQLEMHFRLTLYTMIRGNSAHSGWIVDKILYTRGSKKFFFFIFT